MRGKPLEIFMRATTSGLGLRIQVSLCQCALLIPEDFCSPAHGACNHALSIGWWSHIVIDVFTHSAEFYPVPLLYPLAYSGFDGLAWNTPWFMALTYPAIAGCAFALRYRRS
jgi:membrane-bound metal-dependent hydrolase YbcI (DUF457 family)